ncbi:MAG: oligopeptidase B, partial [Thermoanaerobaculia bacterium]
MKRFSAALIAGISSIAPALNATDNPEVSKPPMAKKIAKTTDIHGEKLADDYFWLRDRQSPEVKAYLEAENAFADSAMKSTTAFQEALYKEMLGRIKETDLSVPYREGESFYYSRTEQGKQYPIYCRKKGSLEAPEQVMLDLNEMAKGQRFMAVAALEVSDDGNLLAYSTDNTGFREYKLHVRDLTTGKDFPETVEKVSSVAWAAENKTLFYTVDDQAKRPYRLYRHSLGADPKSDALVYEEKDEMFRVGVARSRSRKVVFLIAGSHTADEWRYIPADKPAADFTMISPREKDHEYAVEHRGDLFTIRTNKGCRNFRVVTAPVASPGQAAWKEFLPCRPAVMVSRLDLFANHAAVLEREDGLPRIRVIDLSTQAQHRVEFPEPVYTVSPQGNAEFATTALRFNYQSVATPSSIYDYDMGSKERKLLKRTEVLGGYDPDRYQSERR